MDGVGLDGEFLLVWVVGVGFGPGGDEGDADAAFVVAAFFASERSGGGVCVFVAERGVGAVIAEEEDEGIFGDVEFFELVEEVIE